MYIYDKVFDMELRKMIHAYASICLMHDIIIEIRVKACVHVHLENKHTRVEMKTIVSLYTENI